MWVWVSGLCTCTIQKENVMEVPPQGGFSLCISGWLSRLGYLQDSRHFCVSEIQYEYMVLYGGLDLPKGP